MGSTWAPKSRTFGALLRTLKATLSDNQKSRQHEPKMTPKQPQQDTKMSPKMNKHDILNDTKLNLYKHSQAYQNERKKKEEEEEKAKESNRKKHWKVKGKQ